MGVGEVGVGVGEKDPQRRKEVRRQQTEEDETAAGKLEIPQLSGRRHAHLEQEQAKHTLERRDEQLVLVLNDLLSLHRTDEADGYAADEENEPWIEEHFLQERTGEKGHPRGLPASWALVGLPVRML